ncbi:MAG: uracil-DNA glycosylase [Akkermansiaceae bacterium]|nr:uracil-DNA glycosylase [Akkermansiaceae bacterium]
MITAPGLVIDYLRSLQEQGVERLPVDEQARSILREWMLAAKRGGRAPLAAPASVRAPQAFSAPQQQASASAAPPAAAEVAGIRDLRAALSAPEAPPATAAEEAAEPEIPFFRPGGSNAAEVWENMARMLPGWRPLRELGTLRPTLVPGEGNRQADIMFVGDAPTYYDERAARPFSGEAGEKLNGILKAMGLSREQVYITHLVKFRPSLPRQTTNNRAPNDKEIRFSTSVVELEARLVQPRVIVALGIIAARGLLQQGDLPLADYRRMDGAFCGIPVIVTHHPSYLIRTQDLAERRALWEEMLRAMQIAGLPISDKQRGFFLKK